MNKLVLTCAMSLMMLSTSAMAFSINLAPKKGDNSRMDPSSVSCRYAEPRCDRHDRIHAERYGNDQKMYSRGECYRGDKERRFDFYCSNGDVWMQIDYRRDRPDHIDCKDPRRGRFFSARSIGECEDLYRDSGRRHHHHHDR